MRLRVGVAVCGSLAIMAALTTFVTGNAKAQSSPASSPLDSSNRYVALGDSVPYGLGLADPYATPGLGLAQGATDQGPSTAAYPSLVAAGLGLSLDVRPTNCTLRGDQLSISGAKGAAANSTGGDGQCPSATSSRTVQGDELPATDLARRPAGLVTLQAGADDLHFAQCLEGAISTIGIGPLQHHLFLGEQCVSGNDVTAAVGGRLSLLRQSLTTMIEHAAPDARRIAVLDYYQPIPSPADFAGSSLGPDDVVDPFCVALGANEGEVYREAQVLQGALNSAIATAVADARRAGVSNVVLVDLSTVALHHEVCTSAPVLFSGESMPLGRFDADLALGLFDHGDYQDLAGHFWRILHPNVQGQRAIAEAVEAALS